ncbi:hypothetical protein GCM10025865_18880 [Paraoerskovia sediminicola]|uniref:Uncharacterized protein n=1 Tax=Paraoerskovia sediminicola TaxID=1138587 RepID=A0ABN6XCI2_9CELL|nr:DUF5995 family protein [Paraoerskovia sediminicola]BDZ42589.1 hypothetical protein GCM10025865_18880 [Paraoerskovia sediminicola]
MLEGIGTAGGRAGASPRIGRVLVELDAVRRPLPGSDGVAVFVDVYREVTARVAVRVTDGTFRDPAFVEELDVVFAELFLDVPRALDAGRPPGAAWAPLVDRRSTPGIWPVQHALAGMNAHINHDLALAVVSACESTGRTPGDPGLRDDYERVNDVLAEVVRPIRQGFLDQDVVRAAGDLSVAADLVSNFSIDAARDAAWASALVLWDLRGNPFVGDLARAALARTVGLVGRQLLVPAEMPAPR